MLLLKFRLRDLLSFEMCFLLFILAGQYKDAPAVIMINQYMDITLGMAALSMIFAAIRVWRQGIPSDGARWRYLAIYLAFLSCVVATYLMATPSLYATEKLKRTVVFNSWAILGPLLAVTTREQLERWLRVFMWFVIFASITALITSLTKYQGMAAGMFGGGSSHSLGYAGAFGLTIAMAVILFSRNPFERLALVAVGGLFAFAILLSSTRQTLVALMVVGCYMFYALLRSGIPKKQLFWLIVAPVLLIISFNLVRSQLAPTVDVQRTEAKLSEIFSADKGEVFEKSHRPALWMGGLREWYQHPILGVGFGNYGVHYTEKHTRYPHNYFVELLAEMGTIGFVLGTALMWIPGRLIMKAPLIRNDWIWYALSGLWVLRFTCMMFSGDISAHRVGFAFSALLVVYSSVARRHSQKAPRPKAAFAANVARS